MTISPAFTDILTRIRLFRL